MLCGNMLAYRINKPTEIVARTMCGICIKIVWVKEKLTGIS